MVQHSAWALSFLLVGHVSAFLSNSHLPCSTKSSLQLQMTIDSSESRRTFMNHVIQSTTVATTAFVGLMGSSSEPAYALGGGLSKVNAKLTAYGLPTITQLPDGFVPLLEVYGQGKNRDAVLVQFSHPIDWVVTRPSQDVNGEDGTVQAGEYAKGDTATFYVYPALGKVENLESQDKEFFAKAISKAISQKGDNVYQNFKVTNVAFNQAKDYKNQVYAIVDFKYQLLTGAGFEIDRVGVASVTSVGNAVEVLWTASTRPRFKKTEETLRAIASSFRCYTDGLDLLKSNYNLV